MPNPAPYGTRGRPASQAPRPRDPVLFDLDQTADAIGVDRYSFRNAYRKGQTPPPSVVLDGAPKWTMEAASREARRVRALFARHRVR